MKHANDTDGTSVTSVRLDDETRQAIEAIGASVGFSRSWAVRACVRRVLREAKGDPYVAAVLIGADEILADEHVADLTGTEG